MIPACCPKCARTWEDLACQQALSIELFGECIVCRFVPIGTINKYGSASGTEEELERLSK